jgi:hypothetical protein
VTITRQRHPFEGRSLVTINSIRRRGVLLVLVVLPDGSALLQGLASCGHCGRRLHRHYRGRNASPGYHCPGKVLVAGRGIYCLNVGGIQIDEAVTVLHRLFVRGSDRAADRWREDYASRSICESA